MAVHVVETGKMDWSGVPTSWKGKAQEGEPSVRFKAFDIGSGSVPRGQLVEYEAGHHEAAHSHDEDEILFLLDGGLRIGEAEASPGTLIYIEGGTTYGPLRADDGCRFLRLHLS